MKQHQQAEKYQKKENASSSATWYELISYNKSSLPCAEGRERERVRAMQLILPPPLLFQDRSGQYYSFSAFNDNIHTHTHLPSFFFSWKSPGPMVWLCIMRYAVCSICTIHIELFLYIYITALVRPFLPQISILHSFPPFPPRVGEKKKFKFVDFFILFY